MDDWLMKGSWRINGYLTDIQWICNGDFMKN